MRDLLPFHKVKFQALELIAMDLALSSTAKVVALYLITVKYNADVGKAWPSYSTIGREIGKGEKAVQRAVKELEEAKYFDITRGNGWAHSTDFYPSQVFILSANKLRANRDNNVALKVIEGGQKCRATPSKMTKQRGQNSPPNKDTYLRKEKRVRNVGTHINFSPYFVPKTGVNWDREQWVKTLRAHNFPRLEQWLSMTTKQGVAGYWLPYKTPPQKMYELAKIINGSNDFKAVGNG